ncbi:MAG: zinc ABC transporter substrate-binding protein [Gammaproteobacteria bacterium]|nr:zinc ABC transporter substrate-binding protein [Gammaproteobacteria bacterium]
MKIKLMTLLLLLLAPGAHAQLRVFACEPEWAALAEVIGGERVEAYSATTALQDPHYIQARPSLIAQVRKADLVLCSGAQLEIGWLPALLQKANNRDVMPGTPGYLEASSLVMRLGATANVDRARGDIHPQGNPHIQTNPHNLLAVARALGQRFSELDTVNSESYKVNLNTFVINWQAAIARWQVAGEALRGKRVITHHKSWVYLLTWLGMEEVANLEAVPGIPPTASHLSRLMDQFESGGAEVIIRAPYQHAKPSEWLAERTDIPAVLLPLTIGGTEEATDLYTLFDDIIARLLEATSGD